MRPLVIAAAILFASTLPAAAQSQGERPVKSSIEYKECQASAVSMADERLCLAAEVGRMRAALATTVNAVGIDGHSQGLWRASMQHDCQGEYDLADGGSSADMRFMACEIEATADRADYLLRRGRW